MMNGKLVKLAVASVGAVIAACAPALAMQPAQTKPNLEVGAEAGLGVTNGNKWAVGGDLDYGIRTGFLGQPYTDIVLDALNTGRNENVTFGGLGTVKVDTRATLLGLGVRQPLNVSGTVPVAIEGGLDYLSASGSALGISRSTDATGAYLGARGTWTQSGAIGLTGMFRYHFLGGGFYQLGAGLTGPINKGTGLYYQIDYYHTGGARYAGGVSSVTDTILLGVRFTASP